VHGSVTSHRRLVRAAGLVMAAVGVGLMAIWLFTDASRWVYGLSFWVGVPGIALVVATSSRRGVSTGPSGNGPTEA
jgi:hypothetical protein